MGLAGGRGGSGQAGAASCCSPELMQLCGAGAASQGELFLGKAGFPPAVLHPVLGGGLILLGEELQLQGQPVRLWVVSRGLMLCWRDVSCLTCPREFLCMCFNGSSSSVTCDGLNPSGTALMEMMVEMVSLCLKLKKKKKEKKSKQMESEMCISAKCSILSKSLSTEITTLCGKMYF